jgi:hypothetical protein
MYKIINAITVVVLHIIKADNIFFKLGVCIIATIENKKLSIGIIRPGYLLSFFDNNICTNMNPIGNITIVKKFIF